MLIGRERELGRLGELLAGGGSGGVLGEAGIGKTSLLRAVADRRGAGSAEGCALAALGHVPYLPLMRALGREPPDGDSVSVAAWVQREVAERTLILDDLQWADRATLALVPLLADGVALLVGIRSGDGGTRAALDTAVAAGLSIIEVPGLERDDAVSLVRAARPELSLEDVDVVVERARGNPLLLEELGADGVPSATLRLSIRARLARCSADARTCMAMLGLLARPAEPDLLPTDVAELLDKGLVEAAEGTIRLRHPLFGEIAASDLRPRDRAALHRILAARIDDPGESARHFALAGDAAAARAAALDAARSARRVGERAAHLALAASCSDGDGADVLRLEAAEGMLGVGEPLAAEELLAAMRRRDSRWFLAAGRAAFALGDHGCARSLLDAGLESQGDPADRIRLRLHANHVAHFGPPDPGVADDAKALLREARSAGVDETRARWLYGAALYWMKGSPRCLVHLRRALLEARNGSDFDLEGNVATSLFGALQAFGRPREALAVADETAARASRRRLRRWEYTMRWCAARLRVLCFADVATGIGELTLLATEIGLSREARDQAVADLAVGLACAGRYEEAHAAISRVGEPTSQWGRTILDWADGEVSWLAGEPRRALAASARLLAGDDGRLRLYAYALRGWSNHELGRPVDGRVDALTPSDGMYAPLLLELSALVDLQAGRYVEAEGRFREAAAGWRRRVLYYELRARWAAAICAVRAGDVRRGRIQLLALERRVADPGLLPLRTRTARALREAGVQRRSSRVRSFGLTAREREVLELVGAGHTSSSIALRLGVAPSTVERIVRTAVSRLGARNRTHAAAMVAGREEGG